MKATNVHVTFALRRYFYSDDFFNTRYRHYRGSAVMADVDYTSAEQELPFALEGDAISITIPSGRLWGNVLWASDTGSTYGIVARWEGSFGGLTNGRCGVGSWELAPELSGIVTESSAIDAPLRLADYIQAQADTFLPREWRKDDYLYADKPWLPFAELWELHVDAARTLRRPLSECYPEAHGIVLRDHIQALYA